MGIAGQLLHVVSAPAAVPYRFGLFSVAQPRTAEIEGIGIDEHWRLGVTWQTQSCLATKLTTGPCIDEEVPALTPDDYCAVLQYDPFTVYSYNDDAVPGRTLAEHEADAIARLVAGEQETAESYVWSLMTASVPAPETLTSYDLIYALGWIEQRLAEEYGGQGVIHMSRLTATLLWENLRIEGGKLTTTLGTPVVAGGGYGSAMTSGSPSSTGLIFGTGPLVMYRGEIDTRQSAIDRSVNRESIIAQRDYLIGWDCVAVGAEVKLTNVTPS